MSWIRRPLNLYLRLTEKPHLRRAKDQDVLRSSFLRKAKLFFHGPWGARYEDFPMGDIPSVMVTTKAVDPLPQTVILYFHGGGYVFGEPRTHQAMVATLSKALGGVPAILPNYRKAPEHPFPAAFEDALTVYKKLLTDDTPPSGIFIGGDSAGGGLALALLAEITQQGLPQPSGVFAFSPLTDMTYSAPSISENAAADVELPAERVHEMSAAYIGAGDRTDPRASPLFAEFTGAAPVAIWVGDTEILLDDSTRMADRLRKQGVDVSITVEHDLPHVWPIMHNILPEARKTLGQTASWIRQQRLRTIES